METYVFFIISIPSEYKIKKIDDIIKIKEDKYFDKKFKIEFIEKKKSLQDKEFNIFLGYCTKKEKYYDYDLNIKFILKIDNNEFESQKYFEIYKYKTKFIDFISFSDYSSFFFSKIKAPQSLLLAKHLSLKYFMENLSKFNLNNLNEIKEELIETYINKFKYIDEEKYFQFYLLLIKYCLNDENKLFLLFSNFN